MASSRSRLVSSARCRDTEDSCRIRSADALLPLQVEEAVAHLLDPEVPMKRLLLLLEMASQNVKGPRIPMDHWRTCLMDLAH